VTISNNENYFKMCNIEESKGEHLVISTKGRQ